MDNVFEAAVAYTNTELNNYVRREDFYGLARGTNATVNTIEARLDFIESEFRDFSSGVTVCGSVSEIEQLKDEVRRIKEVLVDIHMMLRTLELDDMSKRMGDLDMLLT